MSTYHIYLIPVPKVDGVFFQTKSNDIAWKWEVRKNQGDFVYGKIEATGVENTRQLAQEHAETWADALADGTSYDYEAGTGVSDQ